MPAKRKKEKIRGTYFVWLLGQRDGVYYADGRSNRLSAGRHSLGTRDQAKALDALQQLDLVWAVKLGLADQALLTSAPREPVRLAEGRQLYLQHVNRPRVVGGARAASIKRYRAVFDKFEKFAQAEGITFWNQVTGRALEAYAAHLDDEGFAYATEYLELTTLKQVVKWLVREQRLPFSAVIHLPLAKPQGTSTYCWRPEEVRGMIQHCRERTELGWLADVLTALACTGLRISELASLRHSDIDREKSLITLTDESTQFRHRSARVARQTKSGRGRSFPIHHELRPVLDHLVPAADGLVFHGPRGGRLKPDTVRRVLIRDVLTPLGKQLASSTGSPDFRDGRLHSFRHYFCSACAASGVPERVVMEWLGHRDSAMVRHYFHLHDDEAQRQMKRLRLLGDTGGSVAAGGVS
jgi:integrase